MSQTRRAIRRVYAAPKGRWGQALQLVALRASVAARMRRRLRDPGEVVLIHQVGKTGSKAIEAGVGESGLAARTFHTHILNVEDRARLRSERREGRWSPPQSWVVSEYLLRHVVVRPDRYQLLVICPVREPVARNVSAFFYNADPAYLAELAARSAEERIARARRDFLDSWDHDRVLEWPERELDDQLRFDRSSGFDPALGHATYENSDGARCLVLRQEDLGRIGPSALSAFLGRPVPALHRTNAASERSDASLYREFCSRADLPSEYLERMYRSTFATTHYSSDEIAALTERWSERPRGGSSDTAPAIGPDR